MRKPPEQKLAEIRETFDERLEQAIRREQLSCVMNTTKWDELFRSLEPIQEWLTFRRKDVRDDDVGNWKNDLHEMLGLERSIEWLEIDPQAHDRELREALQRFNIPYSTEDGVVRVWGYVRPGESPNWASESQPRK